MAKSSGQFRLYLAQAEARQAVQDAAVRGRIKWKVQEESDGYLKLKEQGWRTIIFAPVRLEIGFRKESPETTMVVLNGVMRGFADIARVRVENYTAIFSDDVQAAASRYVKQ